MNKITYFVLAFALMLSAAGISNAQAAVPASHMMAGQNTEVGEIFVSQDATNLNVQYKIIADGWCMTETHLALASSVSGIPQTKTNNPIPGKFAYSANHEPCVTEYTYSIPLSKLPSGSLTIAAHAAVIQRQVLTPASCVDIVSDANTMWSADGINWIATVPCFVHTAWNKTNLTGATWVWRTFLTDVVWEYNNVPNGGWYFRKTFTLPGAPGNVDMYINADNTYSLSVNGSFIGTEGSMNKVGPDLHEWGTVDKYTLTNLTAGVNTIDIRALNFFNTYDSYSNPAGLAFQIPTICYKATYGEIIGNETAWGSGFPFAGKNWATYFTYQR